MTADAQTCPEPSRRIEANRRNALRHDFRAQIILDRAPEFPNGEPEAFAAPADSNDALVRYVD